MRIRHARVELRGARVPGAHLQRDHLPAEIMDRLETASRIEPEYPGAFIDFIQGWLGNR